MTLNLAAIFGDETGDNQIVGPAPTSASLVEVAPPDPVPVLDAQVSTPVFTPCPIVEGTEHFSIWQEEDAPWIEFIPGYHYDFRQPSRLQPLCSPRTKNEDQ